MGEQKGRDFPANTPSPAWYANRYRIHPRAQAIKLATQDQELGCAAIFLPSLSPSSSCFCCSESSYNWALSGERKSSPTERLPTCSPLTGETRRGHHCCQRLQDGTVDCSLATQSLRNPNQHLTLLRKQAEGGQRRSQDSGTPCFQQDARQHARRQSLCFDPSRRLQWV